MMYHKRFDARTLPHPMPRRQANDLRSGFDQFLDVLGVEKHLRDKGIKFKEDSVQLDANESLMSNDVLNFDTGFQESTGQQEVLPFGLVDEGDGKMFGVTSNSFGGIPTPESQGSPVMTDDWMQVSILFLTTHLCGCIARFLAAPESSVVCCKNTTSN